MKKKIFGLFVVCSMIISCFNIKIVKAANASYNVSLSSSTIEQGESIDIYFSCSNLLGKINVNINGSYYQSVFADGNSVSPSLITYTPSSSGEISITTSPSSDSGVCEANNPEIDLSNDETMVKSLSLTVKAPATPPSGGEGDSGDTGNSGGTGTTTPEPDPEPTPEPEPEPEPEPVVKSDDARLYSLSVDNGTLSPSFNSSVTEYTVDLTSKYSEITISASAWDDWADVEGTGVKPIKIGSNSFSIDVTAEDGVTKRTYTINVNVTEVPVTYLDFNNEQYGIMKQYENGDIPKGFKVSEATINEEKVPVFVNEKETLTLVYAANPKESLGFYLYTQEDGILGLYRPLFVDGKEVYIVAVPDNLQTRESMAFATMSINGEELQAWTFEDKELVGYSLIYVMNDEGLLEYYVFNESTSKLTKYPESTPITYDDFVEAGLIDKEPVNYGLYGGIAGGVVLVLAIIFFIVKRKKKEVVEETKEEDLVVNNEETKEFTFEKEDLANQEGYSIETDLQKIKELEEFDDEVVTPIIPTIEEDEEEVITPITPVVEEDDEEWITEDFYKTILGEEE